MKSPILMRVWRDNKKPAEQWSEAEKDESGMASPYIKRVRPIHIKPCTNKGELKCPKSSTNGAGPVLVIPDADEIDPGEGTSAAAEESRASRNPMQATRSPCTAFHTSARCCQLARMSASAGAALS